MFTTGYIKTPEDIIKKQPIYIETSSVDIVTDRNYLLPEILPVVNQGSLPICIGQTINEMWQWKLQMAGATCFPKITPEYIYRNRSNREIDGMTPVDGFNVLTSLRTLPEVPVRWARVTTPVAIRNCVVAHGPVMMCMLCRSFGPRFWEGSGLLGGHAVSIVGWENDEILFKNSWGYGWGDDGGYGRISFLDICRYALELWVLT